MSKAKAKTHCKECGITLSGEFELADGFCANCNEMWECECGKRVYRGEACPLCKCRHYLIETTQGGHDAGEMYAVSLEAAQADYLEGEGIVIREDEDE